MKFVIFLTNAVLVIGILRLIGLLLIADSKDDMYGVLDTALTVGVVVLARYVLLSL